MNCLERPLNSIITTIIDNRGKTCPTSPTGFPLIATNCIKNDRLYPIFENIRYINNNTYSTWFRDHPIPGDIILVLKGTPGRVAFVPDPVNFCIAQDMVAIRADTNKIYPKYLFAILRSNYIQAKIDSLHVGTLIPHFKKNDFKDLIIPIPSCSMQEFIGDTYFDISSKIELLHRQNATLEAMAEALFKQWFVVEAKDEWEIISLGELCDCITDKFDPKLNKNITKYIGLEHIDRKKIYISRYGNSNDIKSIKFKFKTNDILFGKLRPYFYKICFANFDGVCSTDILVLRPKSKNLFLYSLFALYQKEVVDFATYSSSGTRMPRVDWNTLKSFELYMPDITTLKAFNHIYAPLINRITTNQLQISTLENLRDTLLPKLMSGEVRVKF